MTYDFPWDYCNEATEGFFATAGYETGTPWTTEGAGVYYAKYNTKTECGDHDVAIFDVTPLNVCYFGTKVVSCSLGSYSYELYTDNQCTTLENSGGGALPEGCFEDGTAVSELQCQ